jgi:hypothetical protein
MTLGRLLLEEGIEIELETNMTEVIDFLETEVPGFDYDDYGYRISSAKGILGSQWKLLVKPWNKASDSALGPTAGFIEIDKLEEGRTNFKIPPKDQWLDDESAAFDEEGKFFASFVFQLLNALQSRGFIELPGRLPVR